MAQKLENIHNNPVVEGIVDVPEEYLYSSARNYSGRQGLIEVELIGRSRENTRSQTLQFICGHKSQTCARGGVEGIVDVPEEYLYSSARNYSGWQGLIEVELIG